MKNEYPRMMYKAGGGEQIHGGRFSTLIVHDQDELETALAGGWSRTTPEAVEAARPAKPAPDPAASSGGKPEVDDDAPPTRDELKQKANELGLTYAGNISTEKLAALVETALAGGDKAQE